MCQPERWRQQINDVQHTTSAHNIHLKRHYTNRTYFSPELEKTLQGRIDDFVKLANAGTDDVDELMKDMYTSDAVVMPPGSDVLASVQGKLDDIQQSSSYNSELPAE